MAGLEALGAVVESVGTLVGGSQENKAKQFEAQQYVTEGKQQFAASQRTAEETQRQKESLISSQIAAGAKSGFGGATDTSTLNAIGDVEQEGTLRQLSDIYEGKERQRGMNNKAKAARFEGKNAQLASYYDAAGTLASGLGKAGKDANWASMFG
jgi:hypothetical protein